AACSHGGDVESGATLMRGSALSQSITPRANRSGFSFFFFFNDPATSEFYTLSLHDALPIFVPEVIRYLVDLSREGLGQTGNARRSEEHTSELQSRSDLVCRLLLEKKKRRRRSAPPPTLPSSLTTGSDSPSWLVRPPPPRPSP